MRTLTCSACGTLIIEDRVRLGLRRDDPTDAPDDFHTTCKVDGQRWQQIEPTVTFNQAASLPASYG